jgi:hypothetical protein
VHRRSFRALHLGVVDPTQAPSFERSIKLAVSVPCLHLDPRGVQQRLGIAVGLRAALEHQISGRLERRREFEIVAIGRY